MTRPRLTIYQLSSRRNRTYPNMRSIHSWRCAETCSLSRAILCLCMKSTGFSAQGGKETESGMVNEIKNTKIKSKRYPIFLWNKTNHTKLLSKLCCTKVNWVFICEHLREVKQLRNLSYLQEKITVRITLTIMTLVTINITII